ncbi:MAG: helix-turn-helix domain-containing protein [Clostridiales bacterium]|nr:helix-turn-helix domain-containing protein [Clostridiales bacterium]
MTINEAVAVNVRRERKAKGLSLDRAAKLTGVSKSMLGQIERGEVNPTVSVLYKIAAGLELECSTLLEIPVPAVEFVSSTNSVTRKEDGGKVMLYSLFPSDTAQSFSIYRLRLLTSGHYEAPPVSPAR